MADFPGLPENVYEYVNQFDYAVWTPGTRVTACNVPWDASYRDVVSFASEEDKAAWFQRAASSSADGFTLTGLTYLKFGEPVRLPMPFSQVNQCNYLVVRNPEQPVPSRVTGKPLRIPDTFYYFVTDVRFLAPNCTELTIQLDVWTTYADRLTFGRSFVARGHAGIANEYLTMETLENYVTDPEGLEIGAEYDVKNVVAHMLNEQEPYAVLTCTCNLIGTWGDIDQPHLSTAFASDTQGIMSPCEVYAMSMGNLKELMRALSDAPWISQCIQSIVLVPYEAIDWSRYLAHDVGGATIYHVYGTGETHAWDMGDVAANLMIPPRYRHLLKLYTYPYSAVEVTAYTGGSVVLRPEAMSLGDSGHLYLWSRSTIVNPDVRMVVWPYNYNAVNEISTHYAGYNGAGYKVDHIIDDGEYLDVALTLTNFPRLPVVNNSYLMSLASTAYTRDYQYATADWAYAKSMASAQLAQSQGRYSMGTAQANQDVSNQLAYQSLSISQQRIGWSGLQGVAGGLASAGGALMQGNLGGAAGGAIGAATSGANAALESSWAAQSTANQVGAANSTLANNLAQQRYNIDSNYAYASMAAAGDYKNAIAGIQAQVQSAQVLAPTVSGQAGGDLLNWAYGLVGVFAKYKTIKPNYMVQVGEWFLRYGYIVNRWIDLPADLALMDKFTYWEVQDPQVFADMPEVFKQTVRGILSAGVTVWTSPDYIGRTDFADNHAKGGFSY